MNTITIKIKDELKANRNQDYALSGQRFFKEDVKMYGIKSSDVSRIAKSFNKEILSLDKKEVFDICDELWQSEYMEESFIACHFSYIINKKYEISDFKIFERWVNEYVNNWASCDTLCNHSVGTLIEIYPELLSNLKKWAKSNNRWVKRASAVSLIIPARRGKFLFDIFEIADILFLDSDDLVQKGYGWMLKAASESHQKDVFDYVFKNKTNMPRTSLRYAIEKMPKDMKLKAMAK